MCMQPLFFSIKTPHLGHGFELDRIHRVFSASDAALRFHSRTIAHLAGAWPSAPHEKHIRKPHPHSTTLPTFGPVYEIARPHDVGFAHHRSDLEPSTNELTNMFSYLAKSSPAANALTSA